MRRTFERVLAFALAPARDDEARGLHAGKVLGGLEADAAVRAGDDDGLAREVDEERWREARPLLRDEGPEGNLSHILVCTLYV